MHILITNDDDGVIAPGLLALAQEMRKLGKLTVFAPDKNWSASGHVKTMERPLRVREDPRGKPYYWIGGESPTGVDESGTDFGALKASYVSITPLQLDLTNYKSMDALGKWSF